MTRINTNVGSLVAQNRLNRTNMDLQTALTRLSTGMRINSGKDDPAGLIASEALRSDITSLNKAISNTKRASQIIATADSALGQVSSLLNNIRGLAVEAANSGAMSESEIAANQLQVDSSLEAINRIARTTTFQGRKLLDGSMDFLTTAGTNYAQVKDLKINQANLGSTGQMAVSVNISSAAQQAQVAVGDIAATVDSVASTGSLTLERSVTGSGASRTLEFTRTIAGAVAETGAIDIDGGGDRVFTLLTKEQTDAYNGYTVNVTTTDAGNFSSITIDDDAQTITVRLEEGKALGAIATELADHAVFELDVTSNTGTVTNGDAAAGVAFATAGTAATTQTASITVTAAVDGLTDFDFVVADNTPPDAVPSAALNGSNIEITVGSAGNTRLDVILAAINGIQGFSATLDDPDNIEYFDPADHTTASGDLVEAVEAANLSATINLSRNGAAANGATITFATGGTGAPTVAVDVDGNLTITVDDSISTSIDDIVDAINQEGTYTAEAAEDNTLTSFQSGDADSSVSFDNGVDGQAGGISHNVVFELLGKNGSEVFNVSAGTTLAELVTQINLVSDATGVSAAVDSDDNTRLILKSTAYGSEAIVDLRVIQENALGSFTSAIGAGARDFGADIAAKVNGTNAKGRGNTLSVNTASLAMTLTVAEGSSDNIEFSITGGGALFQLGSDVVSNQQARVGISSVSTSRLGGVSGRLFQLGSGEIASLESNPGMAVQIVSEAISQVTSLRGRLGAFQSTTLESNMVSLTDTVGNLTEAESSIRDADFAQETARLTRAQILVQSGTTVLALANQSPQNALALLR
ncbi:MAG: flagellin [Pirellulaceae bacterium]|nr:flagellin [Pirellulaceae bacterium]